MRRWHRTGFLSLVLLVLYLGLLEVSLAAIWQQSLRLLSLEGLFAFAATLGVAGLVWVLFLRRKGLSPEQFWFLFGNGLLLAGVMSEDVLRLLLP